jgi:ABC-type Fe3+/spermidine/putrescine transport system ATPase subunit
LLDEPLSALDAGTRLDVQAELKRHLADFAGPCLLVTHDALEALVLADRLLVLEGGRVAQEGTPAQIARQPATDYVAKLVGLNLYAGQADGSQVKLTGAGPSSSPTRASTVTCSWRCVPPPSSSAPSAAAWQRPATPGRRRSPGSRCWPTGSGWT